MAKTNGADQKANRPPYEEICQSLIMLIGYCMADVAKFKGTGMGAAYADIAVRLGVDPGYFNSVRPPGRRVGGITPDA